MALVPPLDLSAEEVRELLLPLRNELSVAVYNCQNAFAVGAIIRVAHSFLVRELIVIGEAPWYEKASMGMQHYEKVVRVPDEASFFRMVEGRPVWSVERDHATVGIYDVIAYPHDVVLVFGSERSGLPTSVLERSEVVLGIPMYGINHSFPVAVAAGMVLFDWARRRYAPGTTIVGPARDRPSSSR
jgi:tRNA G18 (ribose-2'-O)-methylase SpoU